jgi:hypothetical protein
MATDSALRFFPSRADALGPEDFETASIRSAAPSYGEWSLTEPPRLTSRMRWSG